MCVSPEKSKVKLSKCFVSLTMTKKRILIENIKIDIIEEAHDMDSWN